MQQLRTCCSVYHSLCAAAACWCLCCNWCLEHVASTVLFLINLLFLYRLVYSRCRQDTICEVVLQCIQTCMLVSASQKSGQEAAQGSSSAVQSLQLSVFAGVLVTLEPLPFANAEGPLQLLSTGQQPAHHTQAPHHQAEALAVSGQPSSGHSPAKPAAAPGKSSLVSPPQTQQAI